MHGFLAVSLNSFYKHPMRTFPLGEGQRLVILQSNLRAPKEQMWPICNGRRLLFGHESI